MSDRLYRRIGSDGETRTSQYVPVEPFGTLTVGVNPDHGGPDFTIDAELLPDGEYLIVPKEDDDE